MLIIPIAIKDKSQMLVSVSWFFVQCERVKQGRAFYLNIGEPQVVLM